MISVIQQMTPRADELRMLNLQIGKTEALLTGMVRTRERLLASATPADTAGFERLLDMETARRTGRSVEEIAGYREQQRRIDQVFNQRLLDDATQPGPDFME